MRYPNVIVSKEFSVLAFAHILKPTTPQGDSMTYGPNRKNETEAFCLNNVIEE